MTIFINGYSVEEGIADSLSNTRVQGDDDSGLRVRMVDQQQPKDIIDIFVSYAIRTLDPNNPGDDEWYAYHQTLVAIANGLEPVGDTGAGTEPELIYEYVVEYAGGAQIDFSDPEEHPLLIANAFDTTVTVRGTANEILTAHNQLIAAGPWRGYWHDPTSTPVERPVYEDTYTILMWKQDREELIDEWGMARYVRVYPPHIQLRDNDMLTSFNAKFGYDVFNALNNASKDRVPTETQGLLNQVDISFDTRSGFAKYVYQSGSSPEVYDAIQSRKEAAWEEYREVTEGVVETPGM